MAPSVYHVIQPFDRYSTQKLADIPPFLLPERWRELFGYLSRGSTVVTSHYQFPEQNVNRDASNSSSCETNIGETALTNSEIDQKRLATSTSKQLKSPNKRHTIFVNTQTSITNATHQRRMKSVTVSQTNILSYFADPKFFFVYTEKKTSSRPTQSRNRS